MQRNTKVSADRTVLRTPKTTDTTRYTQACLCVLYWYCRLRHSFKSTLMVVLIRMRTSSLSHSCHLREPPDSPCPKAWPYMSLKMAFCP